MCPDIAFLTHSRDTTPRPLAISQSIDGEITRQRLDPAAGPIFHATEGVRQIPHHVGMRNTPGSYWATTSRGHIDYESWLEARWLQLLDHDPAVVEVMTQPLTIHGLDVDGLPNHTPDILAKLKDGSVKLIDVKAPHMLRDPDVLRRARLAAALCDTWGWSYHLVGEPPAARSTTVAVLARARCLHSGHDLIKPILRAAAEPIPLARLWSELPPSTLTITVTHHLLWHHRLLMSYAQPIHERTRVWRSA